MPRIAVLGLVEHRRDDLLRRAHERLDGVDRRHRCHPFGMQPSALSQARREALVSFGGGAPGRVAQILGPHHDALAVHRQHQDAPGVGRGARGCLTLLIEVLEILRRTSREFFKLAFRNVGARVGFKRLHSFVEGVFNVRLGRGPGRVLGQLDLGLRQGVDSPDSIEMLHGRFACDGAERLAVSCLRRGERA